MIDDVLARVPMPIVPGPEMAALRRFHRDVTWTGEIAAGGMGPGTPAMTARGGGRHHLVQDGRWVVGDYRQEQFLPDGTPVLTWQLHWVAGWLVFESIGDPAVRLRLTWDLTDPALVGWRNEVSVAGGPWTLVEEYRCTPVGP